MKGCKTCKDWLGVVVTDHDDLSCVLRASAYCVKCCNYGHIPTECDVQIQWDRPETLEELIPADLRLRWGIITKTMIKHVSLKNPISLDTAEAEIIDGNTIEMSLNDKKIRDFMRINKIQTTHKRNDNINRIRSWAVQKGMKIRFTQD